MTYRGAACGWGKTMAPLSGALLVAAHAEHALSTAVS